jgi:hypothetical protein
MAHPFSSFLEVYFLAQLSSQFKVAILSIVVCGKMVFPHLVDVISDSTLGDASPGSHCVHSHGVNASFINLDIHRHVVPTAFPPEEDNAAEMAMKQDPQLYKQVLEVFFDEKHSLPQFMLERNLHGASDAVRGTALESLWWRRLSEALMGTLQVYGVKDLKDRLDDNPFMQYLQTIFSPALQDASIQKMGYRLPTNLFRYLSGESATNLSSALQRYGNFSMELL